MTEIVNIDALPLEAFEEGTLFAAETASIGEPLGLRALGARLHVVQPGKSACPFHRHHGADELFEDNARELVLHVEVDLAGVGAQRLEAPRGLQHLEGTVDEVHLHLGRTLVGWTW